MKIILPILSALALTACVSVEPYTAPDGRTAYLIECNGGLQSMAACMNKASELCKGPYDVLNRDQSTAAVGAITNGTGTISAAKFRTLEVACKT